VADFDIREDWFKPLVIAAPLFASSLAIIYDVGFFFGADIGFFTFFSLSEHIVFALQAIPFVVIPALTLVGLIVGGLMLPPLMEKDTAKSVAKLQEMSQEERDAYIAKLKRQVKWIKRLDPYIQWIFAGINIGFIWKGWYAVGFLGLVSQTVWEIVYPIYSIERWKNPAFRYTTALLFIAVSWVTAFLIGYQRAEATLASSTPTERIFIDEKAIPARLIRGGERGVLFKSFETGKLSFLRWENIKRIDGI
jgi:hypothetical protein